MNVQEYFSSFFMTHDLSSPSGAGDGTTEGDVLAEMPLDSNCGQDCKECIDRAVALTDSIRLAYGDNYKPHHIINVANAVVDVCCCFIRG